MTAAIYYVDIPQTHETTYPLLSCSIEALYPALYESMYTTKVHGYSGIRSSFNDETCRIHSFSFQNDDRMMFRIKSDSKLYRLHQQKPSSCVFSFFFSYQRPIHTVSFPFFVQCFLYTLQFFSFDAPINGPPLLPPEVMTCTRRKFMAHKRKIEFTPAVSLQSPPLVRLRRRLSLLSFFFSLFFLFGTFDFLSIFIGFLGSLIKLALCPPCKSSTLH